jgi:subtilisin family serine protease
MPNPDDADIRQQGLEAQLRLLHASHPDIVVTDATGTGPREPGEEFGHLHREGRLLLRSDVATDVGSFLRGRGHAVRPSSRAFAGPGAGHGTVPWHLDGVEPGRGVQEVVSSVHDEFGQDEDGHAAASAHHVFFLAPFGWLCPATEPQPVVAGAEADPAEGAAARGQGVDVAVLDTGLVAGAGDHAPWLYGISDSDPDPTDLFDIAKMTSVPDGYIDPYAAHGTFISGIIRRIAPAAQMHVRRLSIDLRREVTPPTYGADVVDELRVADHLRAAVAAGQKVVSLSAGGPTHHHRTPLSFHGLRSLFQREDAVLVAAAGNGSTAQPFFPAALDWVVGVGALDADRTGLASYSNHGINASVYAPGTDLVNAYAYGTYRYFQPPETGQEQAFLGLAQWSGTSFATPMVAGLVAARMSAQNETAPEALAALLHIAASYHHLAGVGPTLDPGYTDLGI